MPLTDRSYESARSRSHLETPFFPAFFLYPTFSCGVQRKPRWAALRATTNGLRHPGTWTGVAFTSGSTSRRRNWTKTGIIYKNPLTDDRKHPDHFDTRKLNADVPKNAEIIRHVFSEIERHGLIAVALADEAKKESERQAASKEFQRQQKIKDAALVLLAEVRAVAEGATRTKHCQALLRALGEAE